MTLLERLQSHKGGLLRIKSQLFWYDGRGWDKNPGRVCLILDATVDHAPATMACSTARVRQQAVSPALLLMDGSPHWVWVAEADVEVVSEAG